MVWWFIFPCTQSWLFQWGSLMAVGARQLQPGKGDFEGSAHSAKAGMSNANALKSLLSHPCPGLKMSQAPALARTHNTGIIPFPGIVETELLF